MSNHEKDVFGNEQQFNAEALDRLGKEQREKLAAERERTIEKGHENNAESARHEALEQAARTEKEKQPAEKRSERSPAERRKGPISKKEREASFKTTMSEVQSQMSGSSRAFSKVIHNKAVEKASEAVGSTVARPNAILAGSVMAFIFTLAIYTYAKNFGYPLSGSETIAAFALGWLVGVIFDYARIMFRGKS